MKEKSKDSIGELNKKNHGKEGIHKKLEERKKKTERGKGKKDLTSNLKPWRKKLRRLPQIHVKSKLNKQLSTALKIMQKREK